MGLRSGSVKSNSEKVRENCAKLHKIAGKLRCQNQTSRSFKEQHFFTGDIQGTNKHVRWTSKKKSRKNCGNLRKIDLNPPPPL